MLKRFVQSWGAVIHVMIHSVKMPSQFSSLFSEYIMASDHYMAVGVEQYIIDRDDEDCPEIGLHLAALKGDAVQLEELLTCHKDHVQVDRHISTCQQSIYPTFVTILSSRWTPEFDPFSPHL